MLGSLIEKERTTPQNYPLTLNSLRSACNQSTSRDPVVDYDDHQVEAALASLRERGFVRAVHSPNNRVAKYRHVVDERLALDDAEVALLGVLLLRGPQTVGELKGRGERLHPIGDLDDVLHVLEDLADREEAPLVLQLERRPGQKDARWVHLFAADEPAPRPGTPAAGATGAASGTGSLVTSRSAPTSGLAGTGAPGAPGPAPEPPRDGEEQPAADLGVEIERLRAEIASLRADFDAFRAAFE